MTDNDRLTAALAEQLPETLREVVEVIGLSATLKLVEHWGGLTYLYVPVKMPGNHRFVQRLGIDAAQKLSDYFGGEHLHNIPRCVAALRTVRDETIREENRAGTGAAALALKYGLTERQIWYILSQHNEDDRQSALF